MPEMYPDWQTHLVNNPYDNDFETYDPTLVLPVVSFNAAVTIPDHAPPSVPELCLPYQETFPHDIEGRFALIDDAFNEWVTEERPKRARLLYAALQVLLSKEALQPDVQPGQQFDRWIGWMHRFSDEQATLTYVTPQALETIEDDAIAGEYAWRMLMNNSVLNEWRPMPNAEDEQADLWTWSVRFEGTPLANYINHILMGRDSSLASVDDSANSHHE
jgi:hypothetical protein